MFSKDHSQPRGRDALKCVDPDPSASHSLGVPIKPQNLGPHFICTESESQGVNPASLHSSKRYSPRDANAY